MSEPHRSLKGFQENKVLLCLDRDLYRAFIKLQADRDLGRSYAGLLPFVTGLYQLGYLSQEVYEFHAERYSEPLQPAKPLSPQDKQKKTELETQDRIFRGMLQQWDIHASNPVWLLKVSQSAEKYREQLSSAKELLTKIAAAKEEMCQP